MEDARERKAYYRVRATMDDTAAVMEIEGGNFSVGYLPDGTLLQPVVDPKLVFSYDSAMREAIGFEENSLKELMEKEQKYFQRSSVQLLWNRKRTCLWREYLFL